jgi:hypothetical protein
MTDAVGDDGDFSRITEAQASQKWLELAGIADGFQQRTDTRNGFPVAQGSSLAGDDAQSQPYQLSHAVRQCLFAASDHLHAVKSLVVDLKILHVAGPASLSRGILENTATAYWVLHPGQRDERVSRSLRWMAQNFKDGEKATGDLGLPNQKTLESKLQKLDAVAQRRGLDEREIRRGYTSTEVVKYAEGARRCRCAAAVATVLRIRAWAPVGLPGRIRGRGVTK